MPEKFNIVHIVHGKVNPHGHNGISRVVYYLNKYEKLKGCNSQIWAIVDGAKNHYTYKRDEFVTVECFPRVKIPFGENEIIKALIKKENSINLVHFHLIWFYDKNIIASALKKTGIPFIITTHGTYNKPQAFTGKRLLARWLYEIKYLNMATEIHAITREEESGLKRYGYNGQTFVAYNGIALEEIPPDRNCIYFADKPYKDKIKFIWVGVLREDKNITALIQAVSMLPFTLKNRFVCILIGPDYKLNAKKYLALCKQLECSDNFDYIGPLYGQQKYDAIESSDAFVLPSFSEVFSLALIDAMACAKPSLITNGCGLNDFLKNDFCVVCEPYSEDIARGIEKFFLREAEWPQMGLNARSLVEKQLEWSKIADTMIDNYKRILDRL